MTAIVIVIVDIGGGRGAWLIDRFIGIGRDRYIEIDRYEEIDMKGYSILMH